MRPTVILIFLLVTFGGAKAQSNTIDSLRHQLQNEASDTGRVLLLNQLSLAYRLARPDTALVLTQQAHSLAKKVAFGPGEIKSLSGIASIFRITGNYPRALQLHLEALKKAEATGDERMASTILLSIGIDYEYLGDYRQAVNYTRKVLAIGERLQEKARVNTSSLNLGNEYEKLGMFDSALFFTQQAYNLSLELKNVDFTGVALNNFGNIYARMGKDNTALQNYRLSLPYTLHEEDNDALCESYLGMAKLFRKAGKADSCLYYAKLSLSTAQKGNFTSRVLEASSFLTDYYTSVNAVDSAFVYQSATLAAKDSLFSLEKAREIQSLSFEENLRQQQIQEAREEAQTELKFKLLFGGLGALALIAFILYRNNRQKQKANVLLTQEKEKVESTLQELKIRQAQLVQAEKMASLGELTAGIAHEIQNPLNFVNNFSETNIEWLDELQTEAQKGNLQVVLALAADLRANEEKIAHHGKRADSIVKSMLQHSRTGAKEKQPTNINQLADEYLKLSFQGWRAKNNSFDVRIETNFDETIDRVTVVQQDIGRVLLNLYNNAFYAVHQKKQLLNGSYEPVIAVSTQKEGGQIVLTVKDNGSGIPQEVADKIFHPFFTTKPSGQGTGLGLSLSYDIVTKGHGGSLGVTSTEGQGSEFVIRLPTT